MKKVILKPKREKAIQQRHHWIFSGAIHSLPHDLIDGELLPVYSSSNEFLGTGYFNKNCSLIGRMIAFDETSPLQAIEYNIINAISIRKRYFNSSTVVTNGYRLINGEGDNLPGLIVDKYNDVYVIQISTKGMDLLRSFIVEKLIKHLSPKAIYEKSHLPSRREEGLTDQHGLLYGSLPENDEVIIKENNLEFVVSITHGQKTGFFFDQREMRQLVKAYAHKKRVLNTFAYTGGFSVYAFSGGALQVDTVEISKSALDLAKRNISLNCHSDKSINHSFFAEDVFDFLKNKELNYDLIILDPPAFAKKQRDINTACRGYKEINRLTLQKIPSQSILLTSSCSYHVNKTLFQQVVFQSALEAKRRVRIIGHHRLAFDHPINLYHPEGNYLKTLVLEVD